MTQSSVTWLAAGLLLSLALCAASSPANTPKAAAKQAVGSVADGGSGAAQNAASTDAAQNVASTKDYWYRDGEYDSERYNQPLPDRYKYRDEGEQEEQQDGYHHGHKDHADGYYKNPKHHIYYPKPHRSPPPPSPPPPSPPPPSPPPPPTPEPEVGPNNMPRTA